MNFGKPARRCALKDGEVTRVEINTIYPCLHTGPQLPSFRISRTLHSPMPLDSAFRSTQGPATRFESRLEARRRESPTRRAPIKRERRTLKACAREPTSVFQTSVIPTLGTAMISYVRTLWNFSSFSRTSWTPLEFGEKDGVKTIKFQTGCRVTSEPFPCFRSLLSPPVSEPLPSARPVDRVRFRVIARSKAHGSATTLPIDAPIPPQPSGGILRGHAALPRQLPHQADGSAFTGSFLWGFSTNQIHGLNAVRDCDALVLRSRSATKRSSSPG